MACWNAYCNISQIVGWETYDIGQLQHAFDADASHGIFTKV